MEAGGKSYQPGNEISVVAASEMVERSCPSAMSEVRMAPSPSPMVGETKPICWICLDCGGELVFPCKCPRSAHPKCLARWQLQSAGTRKELFCEFCDSELPDWKSALTPTCGANAPAVMNVNFDGRTYSFEVKPGPDGYRLFTEAIRRAFNLPDDSELNITFTCDEPTVPEAGSLLTLQGPGAYDAAVHCASVSAARRINTPTPSRTVSGASEFAQGTGPMTPRSPYGLSHSASYNTLSPFEGGTVLPATPESSSGASLGHGSDAGPSNPGSKRRLTGFGKKIKTALTDLLSVR